MPDTTPQRKAPKRKRAKASTTAKRKASTTRKPATAAKRKAGATAKRKASTTRKPATAAKRKAGTKAKRKAGTKAAAKPAASATAGAAGASRAGGGRRGRGRSTGLPRELLKSFEDGQRAASDAVRKFLETVEEALPLRGNNAPKRQEVVDSALEMTERLVQTQFEILRRVARSAGRTFGDSVKRS